MCPVNCWSGAALNLQWVARQSRSALSLLGVSSDDTPSKIFALQLARYPFRWARNRLQALGGRDARGHSSMFPVAPVQFPQLTSCFPCQVTALELNQWWWDHGLSPALRRILQAWLSFV